MTTFQKIDKVFDRIANWIVIIAIIIGAYAILHKRIIGEQMFYIDYYNQQINK